MIFFWGDPHLFHEKLILEFKTADGKPLRPFSSVEEMHERLVENYNSVVRAGDRVYWLGDITVNYGGEFETLMSRFRGSKRLTVGNHDDVKDGKGVLTRCFKKIQLWRQFNEQEPAFVCSHIPIHPGHFRYGAYNLHAHTHDKQVLLPGTNLPDLRYRCVSVEQTNYTPVSFDEVVAEFSRRVGLIESAEQAQLCAA